MSSIDWKKMYLKTLAENEELKEKIICLESDSHNEISMTEYEDMKEELEEEISELKEENEELKQYKEYYDNLGF